MKNRNMKCVTFFIILFCIIVSCSNMPSKNYKSKSQLLVFEKDTVDLGRLITGDSVTNYYQYINNGLENVKIVKVATSCGCTQPVYDTGSIESNQIGKIGFSFVAGKDTGDFLKTIVVEMNMQPYLKVLYLKGHISQL